MSSDVLSYPELWMKQCLLARDIRRYRDEDDPISHSFSVPEAPQRLEAAYDAIEMVRLDDSSYLKEDS